MNLRQARFKMVLLDFHNICRKHTLSNFFPLAFGSFALNPLFQLFDRHVQMHFIHSFRIFYRIQQCGDSLDSVVTAARIV